MTNEEFDAALVAAGFAAIGRDGWAGFSILAAAREAGLDPARARLRFADRAALLRRFGALADGAALMGAAEAGGTPSERLFDVLMRRIDVLQAHRAGVVALLRGLPADPATALMLAGASLNSMRWLLEAAGLGGPGLGLRAPGLLAVWLWVVRAWERDDSVDLGATMAALDTALARAAMVARSVPGGRPAPEAAGVAGVMPEPLGG